MSKKVVLERLLNTYVTEMAEHYVRMKDIDVHSDFHGVVRENHYEQIALLGHKFELDVPFFTRLYNSYVEAQGKTKYEIIMGEMK